MTYTILSQDAPKRRTAPVPMKNNHYTWNFLGGIVPGDMAIIKVGKSATVDNVRRSVQKAAAAFNYGLSAAAVDNYILVW